MKIEQTTGLLGLSLRNELGGIAANPGADANTGSFMQAVRAAIENIDADQTRSGELMAAVDAGRSDDLVGAMLASQKAGLSFSALVQVRNKLVSAFDDIMRMPL